MFRMAVLGGENLRSLLKEIDYHTRVMISAKNKLSLPYLKMYRETLSLLIDKGKNTTDSQRDDAEESEKAVSSNAVLAKRHDEKIYLQKVIQSFWLGYTERCYHYAKKALELPLLGRHNKIIICELHRVSHD